MPDSPKQVEQADKELNEESDQAPQRITVGRLSTPPRVTTDETVKKFRAFVKETREASPPATSENIQWVAKRRDVDIVEVYELNKKLNDAQSQLANLKQELANSSSKAETINLAAQMDSIRKTLDAAQNTSNQLTANVILPPSSAMSIRLVPTVIISVN